MAWLERGFHNLRLTESQRLALAYLRHRSYIGNSDYCRLTGVDSRVATRELSQLVESGVLERAGTRRWATYRLKPADPIDLSDPLPGLLATNSPAGPGLSAPSAPPAPGRSGEHAGRLQDRIAALLRSRGELSAREISQAAGASRSTVSLILRNLMAEGLVEPTTSQARSRNRRYRWVRA